MPTLAPPHLFAAVGLAADDDPDLPRGTHLRLLPSPLLGFPVTPFGLLRLEPFVNEEPHVDWRDRAGNEVPAGDLDAAGGLLVATILEPDGDDGVTVAVEVGDSFDGVATLLDRVGDRVLARRSAPPWVLGAPRVERLRLEGRGQARLRLWRVNLGAAFDVPFDRWDIEPLSLPIDGTRPWYVGGLGAGPAMDRVRSGAMMRLGPPDQPDGPFDPVPHEDELLRVGLHLPEIVRHCEAMLSDPGTPPRRMALEVPPQVEADGVHSAELKVEGTLLLQAMDPGIGRCLGLVTRLEPPPDPAVPVAYAACGIFAVDPQSPAPGGMTLGQALGAADDAFLELVLAVVTRPRGDDGELGRLREQINGAGLEMRMLVALAAAVPPPDRPETSVPDLRRARWLDGGGGVSQTFRQDFVWPNHALGALVALGRNDGEGWMTQHRPVALPAEARIRRRYLPMLMGRTIDTSQMPNGLLSVAPVPAATPPVAYRVATADLFGRFGTPAEFPVPPPPRPAPPQPAPQLQVVQDRPEDGSAEAISPGHVVVTVPVPGVDRLSAGALPIAQVEIALDEAWQPPLPSPPVGADGLPGVVSLSLPMPPTPPGKTARALISVRFRDSDGTATPESEEAVLACTCTDRRHPPIPQVGKGLIWTSRPGPAPDVEISLSWPAAGGGRYRAFIADAASLGLLGPNRAAIAVAVGNGEGAGLTDRKSFRLLTDPPVEAGAGGRAELRETLPRSLAGVQLLRIVPVSEAGGEAPFVDCPAVPVAVPLDRRPPPPRVTVRHDPVTGRATIRVVALGLDQVALRAAEPGLFDAPPDPDARPPEFRLRRVAGAVANPFYARVVERSAPLELVDGSQDGEEGKVFMAEFEDPDPLPPFLSVAYFAEVRMPAERRLPPGLSELPPDGGIEPLSTAQVEDMPGLFSSFSAAAIVTHAPKPKAPEHLTAELVGQLDGSHLRLSWADPPRLHPKLGQSYALRVWTRWEGAAIKPAGADIPLDAAPFAWDGPAVAAPSGVTVFAALVDPFGRMGPTVEMNVAPPD